MVPYLIGVLCLSLPLCLSINVFTNFPESELSVVVERSWALQDIQLIRGIQEIGKDSQKSIVLLNPLVINTCDGKELGERLINLKGHIIVDDKEAPNIVIGDSRMINEYLNKDTVEVTVNSGIVHVLTEAMDVGMAVTGSLLEYNTHDTPCMISVKEEKTNLLFRIANYLPQMNTPVTWPGSDKWHGHCHICEEILKSPYIIPRLDLVVVAGFITQWTPLLYNWLSMLLHQDVKTRMFYLIYNNVTEHEPLIQQFLKSVEYDGIVLNSDFIKGKELSDVKQHSSVMCSAMDCSYLFSVDSEVTLLRRNIITHLAQYNRSISSTLVNLGHDKVNYMGDVTSGGEFVAAPDQPDIVDGAWGMFVVSAVRSLYLIRHDVLPDYRTDENRR